MGLKLQSHVVTFENFALLYFIDFFSWGFSTTKSGRRMCHQAIMMSCQHFCHDSTRRSDVFSPLLPSFMIRSRTEAPGAECVDGYLQQTRSLCSALCWSSAGAGEPCASKGSFLALFWAQIAKFLVMERVWADKQHSDVD